MDADRITALVEALENVTLHLIAAESLLSAGGKKAAWSDKVFAIMLDDCRKSIEVGRAALAHPALVGTPKAQSATDLSQEKPGNKGQVKRSKKV